MRTSQERKLAKRLMKKPWGKWEKIDLSIVQYVPKAMTRSYRNNHCVVMVFDDTPTTAGNAIKIMIQRHDDAPIHDWQALFRIKNELFGKETTAIEYYPPASELVDHHNIYWLWVFQSNQIPMPLVSKIGDWYVGGTNKTGTS